MTINPFNKNYPSLLRPVVVKEEADEIVKKIAFKSLSAGSLCSSPSASPRIAEVLRSHDPRLCDGKFLMPKDRSSPVAELKSSPLTLPKK